MTDQFEDKARELLLCELYDARLLVSVEALAKVLRGTVAAYCGYQNDPELDKECRKRASDWVTRSTAQARSEQRPITPEELVVVRAAKLHVRGYPGQMADADSWRKLELAVGRLP